MNLNEIDINKLHLQSKPVQLLLALIVAVFLVVLGYFAFFQAQWEEYQSAVNTETKLKEEFSSKVAKAANLENLKEELVMIEDSIQVLLKQLPTNTEIPSLIQELHQAAAKNGLTLSKVVPQRTVVESPIERIPFIISVTGSYDQLAQFTRDIGKMSRIVTLTNIDLSNDTKQQGKGDSGKLLLTAMANTYKALDATEVASAASAASAATSK